MKWFIVLSLSPPPPHLSYLFLLNNQLVSESDIGSSTNRRIVKHLNPSLRMTSLSMNTANPWKKTACGREIWNCKQLLLLHIVIYAFIGWEPVPPIFSVLDSSAYSQFLMVYSFFTFCLILLSGHATFEIIWLYILGIQV